MNKVRQFRQARGLRREDLASGAKISYEYVRKLEAKPRRRQRVPIPTLEVSRRIAATLGTTVDDVFPQDVPSRTPRGAA